MEYICERITIYLIIITLIIDTVGVPRVNQDVWKNEIREYSPSFLRHFVDIKDDITLYIEDGYGSDMGFSKEEYEEYLGKNLVWCKRDECFNKDLVLTFKYPYKEGDKTQTELEYDMYSGSTLISMIHYPSRPSRVDYLLEKNINAISLDSIVGIDGRTIYDKVGTSQAGVRVGYELVRSVSNNFNDLDYVKVVILGGGGIGSQANAELHKYNGMVNRREGSDVVVESIVLDKEGVSNAFLLKSALEGAHMVVDCAYRSDPRKYIVSREDLDLMSIKVVVDLAGDNYYVDENGDTFLKAIEPVKVLGNLNQMVFVGDYENQLPMYTDGYELLKLNSQGILEEVCLPNYDYSNEKLYVVSCGSWPGTQPGRFFMYEKALRPLVTILLKKGIEGINPNSRDLDEAELSTGILKYTLKDICIKDPSFVELLNYKRELCLFFSYLPTNLKNLLSSPVVSFS
jgi:alanine dehydrogenase